MRRLRRIAILATLASGLAGPALSEVPLADCAAAVGTFLTRNSLPDGDGGMMQTRSLITLSAEGLATRNDSDQDGGVVGTPFGEGRGTWRCDSVEGNTIRLSAVILNFGYSPEGEDRTLARMDYVGELDSASGLLRMTARLVFLPIDSDPFAGKTEQDAVPVDIVGEKVLVPPAQ
ncbi:MAG TPA: hypothetical protein VJL84_00550 [Kiloniellales bacterium]|nr:hypothetical protein [Kiloniellales bacterium]